MMTEAARQHEPWSSRAIFLLAAIGAAVGLGNIWRFPYLAGEYGRSAFVFIYDTCVREHRCASVDTFFRR